MSVGDDDISYKSCLNWEQFMEMAITGPSPEASDDSIDKEHCKVELG